MKPAAFCFIATCLRTIRTPAWMEAQAPARRAQTRAPVYRTQTRAPIYLAPTWATLIRGTSSLLLVVAFVQGTTAQPVDFGSLDDPREDIRAIWWQSQHTLDLSSGLSLISDHWRAKLSARGHLVTSSLTARLDGTLRGGIYGRYAPDWDEPYDLIRLIDFVRYRPSPQSRWYLRAGSIQRMRLGTGHVVNFFNSGVARDERTVGLEGMYGGPFVEVAGFTDNVLLNGLTGGRIAVRPFSGNPDRRMHSLTFGFNYVTDLHTRRPEWPNLSAYQADVRLDALDYGEIRLNPFISYAGYPAFGSGIGFGIDLVADRFIDLARFRLRVAFYYNGREFIPGYAGSFYTVNSPMARILDAGAYLSREPRVVFKGVELQEALGGNDVETEFRLLIFERFELWYYFRRHYGSQKLSEYHMRLFLQKSERLRVHLGMDRAGLLGFFSLFDNLGDQTALNLEIRYHLVGAFWIFVDALYTFERVDDGTDGREQYVVQRRFEPFVGVRLSL